MPRKTKRPRNSVPQTTLTGHTGRIGRISWSPDGSLLASPSADHTVRLWEVGKTKGKCVRVLSGHEGIVYCAAWAPLESRVATGSEDGTIRIWDADSGELQQVIGENVNDIYSVDWSPDGRQLASASADSTVRVWDVASGKEIERLAKHTRPVYCIRWSPNGQQLASASGDGTVRIWDGQSFECQNVLDAYRGRPVMDVAWSPDGQVLASASDDHTVRIWDVQSGRVKQELSRHSNCVIHVAFSHDGRLLASKALEDPVMVWRTDTWERMVFSEECGPSTASLGGSAFHPQQACLATLGDEDRSIRIWRNLEQLDEDLSSVKYRNVKIALTGDTGVGKTALANALLNKPHEPTDSTHARSVHLLESLQVATSGGQREHREIWLWDMAGQPGYRITHQLNLEHVNVALIVFDSRSDTDPFAGVQHWDRALRQAHRDHDSNGVEGGQRRSGLIKLLVAARSDRGHIAASTESIEEKCRELGCQHWFETSAKEGQQIEQLAQAIRDVIDWDAVPGITSTAQLEEVRTALKEHRTRGTLLSSAERLFLDYVKESEASTISRADFVACIDRLETQGLVRRFNFGDLVLLRPEVLDSYASSLIEAARTQELGIGDISRSQASEGDFKVPEGERIEDGSQRRLLCLAMIEDLLRFEVAFVETTDEGESLVFPAQYTREWEDASDPPDKQALFHFEGAVQNIYAALIVRLAHGAHFEKKELWRNAAAFFCRGCCRTMRRLSRAERRRGRRVGCVF